MHRRTLPLAAALTCAAALAAAGPAAARTTTYEATLNATYTYTYGTHTAISRPDHHASTTRTGRYVGTLDAVLPFVQIEDGRVLPYRAGLGSGEARTSGSSEAVTKDDWDGDARSTCTSDGTEPYRLARPQLASTADDVLALRLFDELEVPGSCDGGLPGAFRLQNTGALDSDADFEGPFDTIVDWSRDIDANTPGKVVVPFHQDRTELEQCPATDYDSGTYQVCSFDFDGELTLVRQDLVDEPDVPAAPTQPTTPTTPTTPTPDGQASPGGAASDASMGNAVGDAIRDHLGQQPAPAPRTSTDAMVDAVSRAIREHLGDADVTVTGRRAVVELTCPGACTGTLSATAVAQDDAINGTPLGATTFGEIADGRAATGAAPPTRMRAVLRLSAADRRALRRKRFVRLVLRVRPAGAPTSVRVTKVVRAPRR